MEYPGINMDIRFLNQHGTPGVSYYRLGSFPGLEGVESRMIFVREVAMMILMDRLTDKPNWDDKIFDETIVAKWRDEALSQPERELWNQILGDKADRVKMPSIQRIMTESAFDYCIAELKSKAEHFKKTGLIYTLNCDENNIIKSDTLVNSELREGLRAAFERLYQDQSGDPDYHPDANDKVQDLVHPSMYPFVYGKSKFFQEEIVGIEDAITKWAGKGEVSNPPITDRPNPDEPEWLYPYVSEACWSKNYQWLPANLAFNEDGTVRFTSYINNLHPNKYPEIYRVIEKLIDVSIPAWESVVDSRAAHKDGPVKPVYQTRFAFPESPGYYEDNSPVWEKFDADRLAAYEAEHGHIPYPNDLDDIMHYWEDPNDDEEISLLGEREKPGHRLLRVKWRAVRDAVFPEPFSFVPLEYKVQHRFIDKFKDTGLQVIVKMATIELTPEKPDFPAGGWHIEGQFNEQIVATALYYVDSENITPSSLSFRMRTDREQGPLQDPAGQDCWRPYEQLYGTPLGTGEGGTTVQNFGSVETREGRLLAFPNVFHHRVSPFRLEDPTKPGHRRFIALWLVDPHQRIISTANVPPQRLDWWTESAFGGTGSKMSRGHMPSEIFQVLLEQSKDLANYLKPPQKLLDGLQNRLPRELMDMVREYSVIPDGIMTSEIAKVHRLSLMFERSAFRKAAEDDWNDSINDYSFCEH
ncbi:hypothetical protein QBC38DRAFT_511743 [Podospora fimiseda]|uniref:Uncharacterized protein n=1 Tax=Podospora fimiseda TaxID=252190 RepID=A0AAN7BJK7_9PEZI|nr:hypothetical protein QBC38DRAFT_511743 [Podospora fimiseda]